MLKKLMILALSFSTNVFAHQMQSTIVPLIGDENKCVELSAPFLNAVVEELEIGFDSNSSATCIQHHSSENFGMLITYPKQETNYTMKLEVEEVAFMKTLMRLENRPRAFSYDEYFVQNNRIITVTRLGGDDYTVQVPFTVDYKLDTLENCEKFGSDIKSPSIVTSYVGSACKEKDDGTFRMFNLLMYPSSY